MTQMTQFGLDFHKSYNFLMCILLSFSDIHVTAAFFFGVDLKCMLEAQTFYWV